MIQPHDITNCLLTISLFIGQVGRILTILVGVLMDNITVHKHAIKGTWPCNLKSRHGLVLGLVLMSLQAGFRL